MMTKNEIRLTEAEMEKVKKAATEFSLLCQGLHLPFYLSVVVSNETEGTDYLNKVSTAQAHGRHLADDKITKYMLVANGFAVVPPRESVVFSNEDSSHTGN